MHALKRMGRFRFFSSTFVRRRIQSFSLQQQQERPCRYKHQQYWTQQYQQEQLLFPLGSPARCRVLFVRHPGVVFVGRHVHKTAVNRRPTKDELLAEARGFFERVKIRIKYPLMRQMRPWTLNDVTAMFSWLFLGQSLWLLVGTTSFVSLVLWVGSNSRLFQEWLAYRIGQYLTSATGATVVFESAIVPNWKDGKIRLNHVHIFRMPRSEREKFERHAATPPYVERKPGTTTMAATAITAANAEDDPLAGVTLDDDEKDNEVLRNYMWFDLTCERVEVTLSLLRWMDGKGLVQSADVKGVRGVIDRRHVRWSGTYDPVQARHKYTPGDFELAKFTLEDLLVTVYQPNGFRPYPISIFSAQLDQFRKQWLFYDILCATSIVGAFDKCLFSVHSPQLEKSVLEQADHIDAKKTGFRSHDIYHYSPFAKPDPNGVVVGGETEQFGVLTDQGMRKQGYKRKSRLRIDGVKIDHINRGLSGPPGWITSGSVDTCADIYIPQEASEADSTELLRKLVYELTDSIELPQPVILGAGNSDDLLVVGGAKDKPRARKVEEPKKFVMDIDFRFKDTKASVPLTTPDLSYINHATVRPVVAYINRNKTIVPIKCRIVMDLYNFDGAWTGYDSTLIDRISEQLGKGFVDLTMDQQERNRRLKRIGYWSLREMLRNIVSIHDMMRISSRGFWSYLGTNSSA
ncbi:mitochondrial distribution and morphology proteins-domain-containing protein [Dichotomocladium elegans]|nr:mitochondrial distribution and morphology proteins-domain-containing protein [Dichotomocladium elegans]